MGGNKDSYISLFKRVCKNYYPELVLKEIECVEKNRFDNSTSSWVSDGYSIFIGIEHTLEYNISEIEYFIESILGCEIIITEQ
jgi:predicted sugar kinase